MTFEYNVNKNSIEYDGKHFAYCNAEQSKIVRKLNKLHDKYEFLEIKNQSLEHYATKYAKLYHQSSKENEELKRRINELEKEVDALSCGEADWLIEEEL